MNHNFCIKFLRITTICFFLMPSIIYAQSEIEVEGIDTAKVILSTSSWQNPTILELNSGLSNSSFTEYHIRNQNDKLRIDVNSDLLGSVQEKDILILDTEGTIETKGGMKPGFTSETLEGTIRYNPSNQALEGYVQGSWRNLNCQSFCLTSPMVGSGESFTGFIEEFGGKISVTLVFNAPVDPASVVFGNTFQMTDPNSNPLPGTFSWNYNHTRLKFRTTSTTVMENCNAVGECFTMRMIGTDVGSGSIKSKSGCVFDGDGDGFETGDYVITFRVLT